MARLRHRHQSANALWVDRTDAVQGNDGDDGDDGDQGAFDLEAYINASSTPTPATPVGGTYNIATGVYTPPTGTTAAPTVPGAGEDVYRAQARINPATQTGVVTPVWSPWVERAHLSPGITHLESDASITGLGTAASPARVTAPILDMGAATGQTGSTFEFDAPDPYAGAWPAGGTLVQFSIGEVDDPDDTDVTIQVGSDDYALTTFGGRRVRLHEIIDDTQYVALGKGSAFVLMGPADAAGQIVDITEDSLPAPDEDAFGRIYLDRSTPAAFMLHETSSARTPVQGTFNTYSGNSFYLGYGSSDADYPLSGQADISKFYWNTADQVFREWRAVLVSNGPPVYVYEYQSVHDPRLLLGGNTGVWLGHTGGLSGLRNKLPQDGINTTRRYIGVTTNSTGAHVPIVQELDNSTYVAAVDPVFTYNFVTVGLYGTGGTGGLTGAQVQALIDVGLANLIDGAPAGRRTLNDLNDAILAVESTTQRHWYLAGGSRNGRTLEFVAPASWPGIGDIVDGDAITFDVPTIWNYNGTSALAVQIGTDLLNLVDVREGEPFLGVDVMPGATYRAVRDGTRWQIISTESKAEIAAFLADAVSGNTETGITVTYNTNTGKLDFVVSGGGGGLTQDEVDARITLLAALLDGATFTGAVAGITPTADAHLTRKDYVDDLIADLEARVAVLEGGSGDTHSRRSAISATTTLTPADVTAGTSSTSQTVRTPDWAEGELRYLYFGVPEAEDDITDIQQGGISVFRIRALR